MELDKLDEIVARGNRNLKDKRLKNKINKLKRMRKCSGNMTPKVKIVNGIPKIVCSVKDRTRARIQKRIMRIRKSKKAEFKKSLAKAQDTKRFRKR